jgi:hypothetical protein
MKTVSRLCWGIAEIIGGGPTIVTGILDITRVVLERDDGICMMKPERMSYFMGEEIAMQKGSGVQCDRYDENIVAWNI